MCGISGIFHLNHQEIDKNQLVAMRDSIAHRGPDDNGIFIDKNLGLAHNRLSIIDTSSNGHQPFLSENQRYSIVFNGEIYNYQSFYPELKAKGVTIRTKSDTEVLLHLYELHGLEMLSRLNGMFAFAIWDSWERKLILCRDRMGVKPLYYTIRNNSIYFASEQKALFSAKIPLQIDHDGFEEYIFNRFVAGENTLFENIKKILPGHYLIIHESGRIESKKWWDLKTEIQNQSPISNPESWFRELFYDSVKLRMVSDVPVGVLLSGGLDSCSVLGALHEQNFKDISTFNIGFKEEQHNESYLAKQISDLYNYDFNSIELENETLFQNLIDATYYQDEPIMHLNEPHLLAISKVAKSKVSVLLSGEGADELMGGYVRYKALQRKSLLHIISYFSQFQHLVKKPRYNKLLRYSSIDNDADLLLFNGVENYPNDIKRFYSNINKPFNQYRYDVVQDAQELYPNNLRRQALYYDQHTYLCSLLDRNDRCTMGASIECREPFLDYRIIAGLGTLDDKWFFTGKKGKFLLKKNMENVLPQEIINFKKVGLSAPWQDYLLNHKRLNDELDAFEKSPIFNFPQLENLHSKNIVAEVKKGNKQILPLVLPLFMLHKWEKNYMKKFK